MKPIADLLKEGESRRHSATLVADLIVVVADLDRRLKELDPLLKWMGDFSAGAGKPEDVMDKILTLEHHVKELRK